MCVIRITYVCLKTDNAGDDEDDENDDEDDGLWRQTKSQERNANISVHKCNYTKLRFNLRLAHSSVNR